MSNPGYYEDPAEQRQRRQHLSARVPADVSQGVLSTGSLVVIGPSEFIIDFVQSLGQRPHVAARVIVPHAVMPQIVNALESSVQRFSKQFGEPAALPANPQKKKPSIRELYDEIKIGDETLAGAYEFKIDFLANVLPNAVVSARVFLSAQRVPALLKSLKQTNEQFQNHQRQKPDESTSDDPPTDRDTP